MKATLIGWTYFDYNAARHAADAEAWEYAPMDDRARLVGMDGPFSGQALAEFAGRLCYESWTKPNPATATNAGYLAHIREVGHRSVLEHGTATFLFTEVSRAFSHELVRHRHFSYSQLSQRFVDSGDANVIVPEVIWQDEKLYSIYANTALAVRDAYKQLHKLLEEKFAHVENKTRRRKLAREMARRVLMEATETKIVVTGNYRSWLEFIEKRATEEADLEIAEVAVACLYQLRGLAPNVFGHLGIVKGEYGEYAIEVGSPA